MLSSGTTTGPLNLITDVDGVSIGNRHDDRLNSGVTVAVFERPATAAVSVLGGAPGTRDTDALELQNVVEGADAVVFAGGSSFGLDAATGAQSWLREAGRGELFGGVRIPIVPQAICFDLVNGGDKDWGRFPPYRELAYEAAAAAAPGPFAIGSTGAGYGATTADLRGGLGSASIVAASGITIGALVVVNALGSAVIGGGPAGLSAAYQLALKGHAVTIFDERAELGGMMRYGIPGFRTPRAVLDAEIARIIDLGVATRMSCRIGTDITLEQIKQDFDAVFLGLGAQSGRPLPVEGADAPNCVTATAFLALGPEHEQFMENLRPVLMRFVSRPSVRGIAAILSTINRPRPSGFRPRH